MKKSIFLTGSKGFIGKHLLAALTDYDVYCAGYNELPTTHYDYIIHLAATTTTTDSFLPELFENNIIYAKQIMSIPTRIIYASSTSAAELTNPYAYTKRYIEYLGERTNSVGLRFFNVYGECNNKGIIKAALSGKQLDVYGGGNARDFIHISDVVRAIIDNLDTPRKIVEVGTGRGMTIFRALQIIEEITGLKCASHARILPPVATDMKHSVAKEPIDGCLSFEDGIKMMWEGMSQ